MMRFFILNSILSSLLLIAKLGSSLPNSPMPTGRLGGITNTVTNMVSGTQGLLPKDPASSVFAMGQNTLKKPTGTFSTLTNKSPSTSMLVPLIDAAAKNPTGTFSTLTKDPASTVSSVLGQMGQSATTGSKTQVAKVSPAKTSATKADEEKQVKEVKVVHVKSHSTGSDKAVQTDGDKKFKVVKLEHLNIDKKKSEPLRVEHKGEHVDENKKVKVIHINTPDNNTKNLKKRKKVNTAKNTADNNKKNIKKGKKVNTAKKGKKTHSTAVKKSGSAIVHANSKNDLSNFIKTAQEGLTSSETLVVVKAPKGTRVSVDTTGKSHSATENYNTKKKTVATKGGTNLIEYNGQIYEVNFDKQKITLRKELKRDDVVAV